ncbi:MAG TPA: N,N-dimethylformamidase beta subunit family domain-containing protein [Burkholderiaceae bacterium]|nr:N,N-dimethylformamidase beta subunit family domain-containing protein [Burkholderiaceae bacterium]
MIRGYPARPSVMPGGTLTLHVSTDAPRFRVAFHRWGDGFGVVHESDGLAGLDAPENSPDRDWDWPAYRFEIGRDWPSGVYVAHLLESTSPLPLELAMEQAAALFVVRGAGHSRMLYKLPIATYQAYNVTGGGCFYFEPPRSTAPPGAKLTWHRPGGGIGGLTFGAPDHYDPTSPRQTFAHWDARFIRWMMREGFGADCEFCTDLDVHDNPQLLSGHRLLLSVGHDEYWSEPMRDHLEQAVGRGLNVAFFGANLCWWRIHVIDGASAMVCHQGGPRGALDHWWPATGVHRAEDSLTGVSYRHGGGWWDGPRETSGYVVQQRGHWVFEGTGLDDGMCFGTHSSPPLVGYECDGAALEWLDEHRLRVRVAERAQECGTPADFLPLAIGPLNDRWQELPHREHHRPREGLHSATMGIHTRGGTVFTVGTTDWAQVLDNGTDAAVARITRNVIARLAGA